MIEEKLQVKADIKQIITLNQNTKGDKIKTELANWEEKKKIMGAKKKQINKYN